ncbi:MAG: hypothetical protein ABI859_02550 [Pseudomonadota bacterium]
MILGMSIADFTTLHVVVSLLGIVSGLTVLVGMLGSRTLPGWTAFFLITTTLTSVTGYFFPSSDIKPSHIVGAISLVLLALAFVGLYVYKLVGHWRWIYVVSAGLSLYLNCFVLVVQGFLKVAALQRLAPTQTEPAFAAAQGLTLLVFLAVIFFAARRFRPRG